MFVVHDRQKLVHRQHLSERFGPQQLLSAAQRDGVAQRPVRVIRLHQVVYSGHRLLRPVHLHPLAADVTERRDKQLESGVQQGALYTYRLLHSYQTAGVRSPAGGAVHIQTLALISNSWSQESSRGRCTHTDSCTHIKQLESGVQQGALYTYRLLHSYQTAGVRSPAGGAVHIQTLALISNSWSQESSRGRCTHTDSCTHIKQLESGVQQGALYTYRLLYSSNSWSQESAGGAVHIQTAVLIKQLESGVQQGALYTYRLLYSSNSWSQESSRGALYTYRLLYSYQTARVRSPAGGAVHIQTLVLIKQLESGVQQGALYTYRLLHSYQTAGVRSPAGGAVHIQTLALISNSWSQESSRGRCTHTDSCTHIKQLESGVQQGALYTYRLLYSSNSWSQESSRGRCTHTDSCTHIKQLESGVQQGALYIYRLLNSYQTAGVRSPAGGAVHLQTLKLLSNSWSQESSRGRCTHTDSCTHIKQLESGVQQGALYTYRLLHSYQTAGVRSPAGGAVHIQTLALISNSWSQESSRGRCTHTDSCTHQTAGVRSPAGGAVHI